MNSLDQSESQPVPHGIKQVVFDEDAIALRVGELASEVDRDYRDKKPVLVCILDGGFHFAQALSRQLSIPARLDSIRLTRYDQRSETGAARVVQDLREDIRGEDVLLIGDIVDTGLSLNYLVQILLERDPATLRVCTLLDRADLRLVRLPIGYVGFKVNDEFLVGYGLNYRGHYRDLPYLATLDLHAAQTDLAGDEVSREFGSIEEARPW